MTLTEGSVSLLPCRSAEMLALAELALWALLTLSLQWCVLLWRRFFGKKWFLTYHFIFKFLFQKTCRSIGKKRGLVYTNCPLVNLNSSAPDTVWLTGIKFITVWEHTLLTWECKALCHEHALGNFWKPQSLNWLEDDSEELEAAAGGFWGTGSLVQGGRVCHLPCHFGGDRLCSTWSSDLIFLFIFISWLLSISFLVLIW